MKQDVKKLINFSTGKVLYLDKEILHHLNVNENDAILIQYNDDNSITLKKFFPTDINLSI